MREIVGHFMNEAEFYGSGLDFSCLAQSSLKRRFVPNRQKVHFLHLSDAKGPENTALFVHRPPIDSLRRHGVDAAILQQPSVALAAAEARPSSPPRGGFSSQRSVFGFALFSDSWAAAHQSNGSPAIQRNVSLVAGAGSISRSEHAAQVFAAAPDWFDPQVGAAARSVAPGALCSALDTQHSHFRFGLGGADALRPTAGCSHRIQSQEERQALLSSPVVLRSASAGVLARVVASRRRGGQHGSRPLPAALSGQGAEQLGPQSNSTARRCGIL